MNGIQINHGTSSTILAKSTTLVTITLTNPEQTIVVKRPDGTITMVHGR